MADYDSWCRPIRAKNGKLVYGGAARNCRIAARGGMEVIMMDLLKAALECANTAARRRRSSR